MMDDVRMDPMAVENWINNACGLLEEHPLLGAFGYGAHVHALLRLFRGGFNDTTAVSVVALIYI